MSDKKVRKILQKLEILVVDARSGCSVSHADLLNDRKAQIVVYLRKIGKQKQIIVFPNFGRNSDEFMENQTLEYMNKHSGEYILLDISPEMTTDLFKKLSRKDLAA